MPLDPGASIRWDLLLQVRVLFKLGTESDGATVNYNIQDNLKCHIVSQLNGMIFQL